MILMKFRDLFFYARIGNYIPIARGKPHRLSSAFTVSGIQKLQ